MRRSGSVIAVIAAASAVESASSTVLAARPTARSTGSRSVKRSGHAVESEAGMRPVTVIPMGPRVARADGVPLQRYRSDDLSNGYRRRRTAQAADAHAETRGDIGLDDV